MGNKTKEIGIDPTTMKERIITDGERAIAETIRAAYNTIGYQRRACATTGHIIHNDALATGKCKYCPCIICGEIVPVGE